MIRHWFRLLWNRRRHNGAIILEIATCFLVLCAVSALGLHQLDKARKPIGYAIDDVYRVNVGYGSLEAMSEEEQAGVRSRMAVLLDAVQAHSDVRSAAVSGTVPYLRGRTHSSADFDGQRIYYIVGTVTMDFDDVFGLRVSEGRWFDEQDRAKSNEEPVVISRELARFYFGDEPAVGRIVPQQDEDGNEIVPGEGDRVDRVIGTVDHYRRLGEFAPEHHTQFRLLDLRGDRGRLDTSLLVKATAGADARFEEDLLASMRSTMPGWEFRAEPLESLKAELQSSQLRLPIIGVILASFLVLMVGLGLVGVLWQSVSRRTSEFGLRRALGSAASEIRTLVLGELMALATVSALIGGLLFVQAPLLGIVTGLSAQVWIGAVALAAIVLYSFVLLCGLYPSWLATRIEPARALQYE